ncbi:uncharacterized protein LOC113334557 [Papaver somniferum]|uniref:uncharacterized protein LOC113334557 n=1 Tax=Papaver somniferum TaxID=3469 RepID=UPI000E7031EF|nr:uncharacterized protein LOC113334557 [Papaver somniferum]
MTHLFFFDADIEQVKNLRLILLSFEMLTGLKINFAKSQIFGVGFDGDLNLFSSLLGCYNVILPTTYLGLPLRDKCGGVAKWDKVVDKFIARLPGWQKSLLSRARKITLINSVLVCLPVYCMSLFEMPISVARNLEKIMRNFLWNDNKGRKKIHPVKWEVFNHALLAKWSWRYATEDDVLWRKIIEEKYGTSNPFWCPKIPNCTFGRSKQNSVADMGVRTGNTVSWNFQLPRRINAAAQIELDLLLADLQSFKFNMSLKDELY